MLDGCELAARALLLRAWFRLLRALHRKGLGRVAIDQVVSKIRGAVLKLAGELRLGCAVAEAIRRVSAGCAKGQMLRMMGMSLHAQGTSWDVVVAT